MLVYKFREVTPYMLKKFINLNPLTKFGIGIIALFLGVFVHNLFPLIYISLFLIEIFNNWFRIIPKSK